jgi:hypothetical protein
VHRAGLFRQNKTYPCRAVWAPTKRTVQDSSDRTGHTLPRGGCWRVRRCAGLTHSGRRFNGVAAAQLGGVMGLGSICELGVSSHGVSATAAKTVSPAAASTPHGGRAGGGVINVSVVRVAVVVTPWPGSGDLRSVARGG